MKSYVTSFIGLFRQIERIEIPLIQRDYAQGREGEGVRRIRESFLGVLHAAVIGGEPVSLDFVYGDVENGTLRPLDGQQRLTTLFLLHWYLASRADRLSDAHHWKRFSYATRASARLFCERLVACRPPDDCERLSAWLEDQAWFLYTWRHDPTIQSMLVMLDAIHVHFRVDDCAAAWERLVDEASPAIAFHLLPVEAMGLGEDLYLKMNSRGKPLTPFETFKARLEQLLESWCDEARVKDFALRLDGVWSDVFWQYRGDDDIVDDELMRFFHFVTEVCEWRDGVVQDGEVEARAEALFGPGNSRRSEHLDFLFAAFDTWVGVNVRDLFEGIFANSRDASGPVVLFNREVQTGVDLFGDCVAGYGIWVGKKRSFALPETLLLYAVILHRVEGTTDTTNVRRRLRVLRNLIEASSNELRADRMPALLDDVKRIVVGGTLDEVSAFNAAQVTEERTKQELLMRLPHLESVLFRLEDEPVLRGALGVLDVDVDGVDGVDGATFERRAAAFHRLFSDPKCWPALTGALLACGDYARRSRDTFQFGSSVNEAPWRTLFTGPAVRSPLDHTRAALRRLLDAVAEDDGDIHVCLERIQVEWLAAQRAYDWRWYLVKYPQMREGRSGLYGIYPRTTQALGYDMYMLDKTRLNSWYRDPYLTAIWQNSGVDDALDKPWFTGGETRWMRCKRSGVEIRLRRSREWTGVCS